MTEKEIQFRKKRELGDIINDSFEFLKQEIRPIWRLLIVYVLPFFILYGIAQVYVQKKIMGVIDFSDPEMLMSNIGPVYMNILLTSLFGIFVQSLLAGTFYSYIEIYIKKGKGNFRIEEITPHLFSNSLLALGVNLVLFIVVILGIMMCIIPGIYFANSLSLAVMIVIYEKKGLGNAIARSWQLVHSQWWNNFLLGLLAFAIIMAASFVLSIPSMIAGVSSTVFNMQEANNTNYPNWYWVSIAVSTIITSLLWILPYTFFAFQYFNLDERTKPYLPN